MGVFLLELKRGDRVAAEKVNFGFLRSICLVVACNMYSGSFLDHFLQNFGFSFATGFSRMGKLHAGSPIFSCARCYPGGKIIFALCKIIFILCKGIFKGKYPLSKVYF